MYAKFDFTAYRLFFSGMRGESRETGEYLIKIEFRLGSIMAPAEWQVNTKQPGEVIRWYCDSVGTTAAVE